MRSVKVVVLICYPVHYQWVDNGNQIKVIK